MLSNITTIAIDGRPDVRTIGINSENIKKVVPFTISEMGVSAKIDYVVDGHITTYWVSNTVDEILNLFAGWNYLSIPSSPTFTDFVSIAPTDTDITMADFGGKTDVILEAGTHQPAVKLNALVGTSSIPIRVKGGGGVSSTIIGNDNQANTYALGIYGGDNVEVYDFTIFGNNGLVCQLSQRNVKIQNCDIIGGTDNFFAFTSKTDYTPGLAPYDIVFNYNRIRGNKGEALYVGQTLGTNYHDINSLTAYHNYAYQVGRENLQVSHIKTLDINHFTGIESGQTDEPGQNRAIQLQDCVGTIKNSFFWSDGSSDIATMRTNGVTYSNNYFRGTNNIYYQNLTAIDWYAVTDILVGDDEVYENCIFYATNPTEVHLFEIQHVENNHIIRNSIISDTLSQLFHQDAPTRIDGGGNIFLPSDHPIFHPTFDMWGRVTSSIHYKRSMGYLMPDPTYPSYGTLTVDGVAIERGTLTANLADFDGGVDFNGKVIGIGVPTIQWQRDADGTGNTWSDIAGETSLTYKPTYLDVGLKLRYRTRAVNEVYLAGDIQYSTPTDVVAKDFNLFLSLPWVNAVSLYNPDIATEKAVTNTGSGDDFIETVGVSLPTPNSSFPGLNFVNATGQNLSFTSCGAGANWVQVFRFKMNSLVSNQRFMGLGGSHYVRITSTGRLYLGATDTGVDLVNGVEYVFIVIWNGASSSLYLNSATPIALSLTTNAAGGLYAARVGSDSANANFFDGVGGEYCDMQGTLTSENITDILTYYGII